MLYKSSAGKETQKWLRNLSARMVHHFGLSCMYREETIQEQSRRLFHVNERVWEAVWRLANGIMGGGRHWCDGLVYEVVICPVVDILDSKEACIQRIDGFVHVVDGQAIADVILELGTDKWTSILGNYFNHAHYILADMEGDLDSKVEEITLEKAKIERKKFIMEAWEVYRVWVLNGN
ncbi:hypothetical protein SUGI_0193690 [Cryptomeria japonica]|nr:hypothetical protein SUGI_0193690 [Cryptomeria japonica]